MLLAVSAFVFPRASNVVSAGSGNARTASLVSGRKAGKSPGIKRWQCMIYDRNEVFEFITDSICKPTLPVLVCLIYDRRIL